LETERTSLFHQNTNIAIALNNSKEDNAALFSQMNKLKGEILQLQTELAAYRTKYDYVISKSPKSSSELDTKLEVFFNYCHNSNLSRIYNFVMKSNC